MPLDDIPPLSLETLATEADKADGLDLVADSVAQMQHRAARSLVAHPVCLAGLVGSMAIVHRMSAYDSNLSLLLVSLVAAAYLLGIWHLTYAYSDLATRIDWSWLRDQGDEDLILGARCDDTLVGALVLQLNPAIATGGRKKGRHLTLRGGTGVIRAWTTKLRSRGQGIGKDLLSEAVRITKERCGKDAEVGFAKEHANSTMLLPSMFNGRFKRNEIKATQALDAAVNKWEATRKRR